MKLTQDPGPVERLIEEQLYAQVAEELASGNLCDGLWIKAISESDGSEFKAKSLYIRYRVQAIKDETVVASRLREAQKTALEKESREKQRDLAERERQYREGVIFREARKSGYVMGIFCSVAGAAFFLAMTLAEGASLLHGLMGSLLYGAIFALVGWLGGFILGIVQE